MDQVWTKQVLERNYAESMADGERALGNALDRFVADALKLRTNMTQEARVLPVEEFANRLADLDSRRDVNNAAAEAADDNGYLRRKKRGGKGRHRAGRVLTSDTLVETGVAGVLAEGDVDKRTLVKELAGYLAGPPIPVWDYAIIDADLELRAPIELVDGWELVTPTREELASLGGIPSAARHVPEPPFPLDMYSGLAMLRRIDADAKAVTGWLLYFDFRPAHTLWQPLLALSLYQNPVVQLWAKYKVEPGRRVNALFDRVYTEPWTPDGVTEIERVVLGDFQVRESEEARFRRFFDKIRPLFPEAAEETKGSKRSRERTARLRRVTEHFLTAAEDAHGEGEVLSEFNADAVLHYVIALEAVLTGDDSNKSDLTRRVVQRAAIIAGTDDEDRASVAKVVRTAYATRSAYAHGSEPKNIELPDLRRVVRDCMLARLILGDPTRAGRKLADLADAALLDHQSLENEIRGPIAEFWQDVNSS